MISLYSDHYSQSLFKVPKLIESLRRVDRLQTSLELCIPLICDRLTRWQSHRSSPPVFWWSHSDVHSCCDLSCLMQAYLCRCFKLVSSPGRCDVIQNHVRRQAFCAWDAPKDEPESWGTLVFISYHSVMFVFIYNCQIKCDKQQGYITYEIY